MDGQVTAGTLVCAIAKATVEGWLVTRLADLCRLLAEAAVELPKSSMGPVDVQCFECRVEEVIRELGRSFVEWCFNSLEPSEVEAMPQQISYLEQSYRRLRKKTPHAKVLTRFGNIALNRATYRQGSSGRTIAPLELVLGIQCGATPGAQDLVGRQVATAGSSQSRCIEAIDERTRAKIGPEKLRNLSSHLADIMESHREACQVEQLERWIDEARTCRKSVILAVSRDGVSLGIAPFGNFEMASVGTVSVYADGQRMGTVYLACAPEENQATLTRDLTSLLKAAIRSRASQLGHIVYVSDAGNIETAYWKNVLRHLHVDGKRIRIERIVDYYHASLRLTTIANALLLTASQRAEWLKRVRKLLLEPGGWGRMMRSIAGMVQEHGIRPPDKDDVAEAKRYLHRYQRFMKYSEYRSHGSPIGSGIVESACKQIVTERLKLSGMRWSHAGARQIMTLRSVLLSQTWSSTFRKALIALPAVSVLSTQHSL